MAHIGLRARVEGLGLRDYALGVSSSGWDFGLLVGAHNSGSLKACYIPHGP